MILTYRSIIGVAKENTKKGFLCRVIINTNFQMESPFKAAGNINAGDIVYLDSQGRIRRSYKTWGEDMFDKIIDKIKRMIARVIEIRNPKYPHVDIAKSLPCFYCYCCEEILKDISDIVPFEDISHCWQCGSTQIEYFREEIK